MNDLQSTAINELAAALSKAQAKIEGAVKDSTNPFFKSKYADLQSVVDAIRAPFAENNLAVTQTTDFDKECGICIITTLMHSSGQWIRGALPIMAIKQDPQGTGSAISYARRYALAAIAGVYQCDDDSESAHGRNHQAPKYEKKTPITTQTQSPVMEQKNTPLSNDNVITEGQVKRLYTIASEGTRLGVWDHEEVKQFIYHNAGVASAKNILIKDYDRIVGYLEKKMLESQK